MTCADFGARTRALIRSIFVDISDGSQTCRPTMFDTAFVAMLSLVDDKGGRHILRYPQTFEYLLNHQSFTGGWEMDNFKSGTLLSTLAGLLALSKHRGRSSHVAEPIKLDLDTRIEKAIGFAQRALDVWDTEEDAFPGSKALVASVLEKLELENIYFRLSRNASLAIGIAKKRCSDGLLTTQCAEQNKRLCQLQAFTGFLECRGTSSHISNTGLSCSPSSTAVLLLATESESDRYDAYLSKAIKASSITGGVPGVFPAGLFEAATVLHILIDSELLDNSATLDPTRDLQEDDSRCPVLFSMHRFNLMNISMQLLIHNLTPSPGSYDVRNRLQVDIVREAESNKAGFDERCYSLRALIGFCRSDDSRGHIAGLVKLICDSWWNGKVQNTLSRSPLYPIMLFAICSVRIFEVIVHTPSRHTDVESLDHRVPIVIVQMLAKVLKAQNNDGSWGPHKCAETTAYGILSLIGFAKLSLVSALGQEIFHAVERGRQALVTMHDSWSKSCPLWYDKTAYGSDRLSESFSLAAMHQPFTLRSTEGWNSGIVSKESRKVLEIASFFQSLPNLSVEPVINTKLAALESSLYVSMLKSIRRDIFPQTSAKEKDKYLDFIPINWLVHSILRGIPASPQFIWDMSKIGMYIFLVDEYMESQVSSFTTDEFSQFCTGIENMFAIKSCLQLEKPPRTSPQTQNSSHHASEDGLGWFEPPAADEKSAKRIGQELTKEMLVHIDPLNASVSTKDRVGAALSVINTWARYHMSYESVISASTMDLLNLRVETKNYLMCHIHQLEDNQSLYQQNPSRLPQRFLTPRMGYAAWAQNVGGTHIGAPIGLCYFSCITGSRVRGEGQDCFRTVKQKLMAWNNNTHAGKSMRMYNDYGSILRDAKESNLSSVNFPEFFGDGDEARRATLMDSASAESRLIERKQILFEAAEYERQRSNDELNALCQDLAADGIEGKRVADLFVVYCMGGDQFSDMYLARDLTNSTKESR